MSYTKQSWVDDVTEVDKAHMDHIEDGIVSVDSGLTSFIGTRGQPSGLATLGTDGLVPASQLPTPSGGGGTASALPTGALLDWAGSSAPSGYLLCDGSAVSRFIYPDLFGVIGTLYGAGDGSSTFNLPDFQGRVAVGKGSAVAVNTVGKNDGQPAGSRTTQHTHTNGVTASHNLTLPNHAHAVSEAPHSHGFYNWSQNIGGGGAGFQTGTTVGSETQSRIDGAIATASTGVSVGNPTSNPAISGGVSVGGSIGVGTPGDGPAYLVINKVIKT